MASDSSDDNIRASYLFMSAGWHALAEETERTISDAENTVKPADQSQACLSSSAPRQD